MTETAALAMLKASILLPASFIHVIEREFGWRKLYGTGPISALVSHDRAYLPGQAPAEISRDCNR